MSKYRNISLSFWTDSKVDDDFTPEDKYFYLYLLTNPHTNICGCYEISAKQMERETGYNQDTLKRLLQRMSTTHNVIRYCESTKEVLIFNWHKYNWSNSEKLIKAVLLVADNIKYEPFREYIISKITDNSIQYTDTVTDTDTVTVTDTVTDVSIEYEYPMDRVSRKKEAVYFPEDEELDKAFKDFIAMRKKIKAPMTERAIELAIKDLKELSGNDNDLAIKIINQSIMRGWRGLFELKEEKKQAKSSIDDWLNA